MNIWLHVGRAVSFLVVQYTLGRRGSYPYGLWMGYPLTAVSILVFVSDLLQTVVLLKGLNTIRPWLRRVRQLFPWAVWARKRQERGLSGRWARWGIWGVLLVSALPYAGGALTGSILAVSLEQKPVRAFGAIALGCLLGTLLFHLGFSGIQLAARGL